ncbi:hypothetical protein BTA51_10380 [Hahella sp. CCB-MM4]|uniref:glycosyltransferase family A protein n=1 Tax=Hahella sp. (strain CCB-MM4) TaxID=1926491 RepID=UPI000B9A1E56|nr:glycosyltransferase family A protein [Hahella sp. CCB-MM4]OZG73423.1 hypothetical protein BTA51_10380 [Hahella sp. CCB-MM4]
MKLGIVIPLKSKQVSRNWQVTCESLKKTVGSLLNQTNTNFDFIVVGHECPDLLKDMSWQGKPVFHSITEIAPPNFEGVTQDDYTKDKNSKIAKGIMLLKERNEEVEYWFPLDADDLVSKQLVSTIDSLPAVAGMILDGGFLFYNRQNRILPCSQLSQYCGSTGIIADQYINCPDTFSQESIRSIPFCRYSHMGLDKFFEKEAKAPYKVIQDKLVVYILSHGDNISDGYRESKLSQLKAYLKPYLKGRKPGKAFMESYMS